MRLAIATWQYGDGNVAEILHIGRYSAEQLDIQRLRAFIDLQGTVPSGITKRSTSRAPGCFLATKRVPDDHSPACGEGVWDFHRFRAILGLSHNGKDSLDGSLGGLDLTGNG
jgi:hypothetical protein